MGKKRIWIDFDTQEEYNIFDQARKDFNKKENLNLKNNHFAKKLIFDQIKQDLQNQKVIEKIME